MSEPERSFPEERTRRAPYLLLILGAILGYGLALLEPLRGPKLWLIFSCAGFTVCVCGLKLRNLIHGIGWVFPRTTTLALLALATETWLYLWFSH